MAKRKQGIEDLLFPRGFLDFQHPKLASVPPKGSGWLHEPKFDGYRLQVRVHRGRATLYTRTGLDWTDKLPVLATMAGELSDCVLDCELCLLNADGYSTFSGLRSAIGRGHDEKLTLAAFDLLWRGEADARPWPLERRKVWLADVLGGAEHVAGYINPIQAIEAGEGKTLLDAACKIGWEGIVSKRLDSPYRGGDRRPDTWVKAKCRPTETVIIGAWVSRGGLGFSHLLAGVREPDGRLRHVGSVKGGFTSEPGLHKRLRGLEAERSPFEIDGPRKSIDVHWVRPELLAEVEIAEWTASGKLRQATFKGLRDDLA